MAVACGMTRPAWGPTLRLWLVAWLRIPLLAAVRPVVLDLSGRRCVIRVRLRRFTRNHHGSMYFGAMAVGADCAAGLLAVEAIRARRAGLALVFKDFQAGFLRRPDGDVTFRCEDGEAIAALVDRAVATGERQTAPVRVLAEADGVPVAEFTLGLSLKRSGSAVL